MGLDVVYGGERGGLMMAATERDLPMITPIELPRSPSRPPVVPSCQAATMAKNTGKDETFPTAAGDMLNGV